MVAEMGRNPGNQDAAGRRAGSAPRPVQPAPRRCLAGMFLVIIGALPLIQAGTEMARGQLPRVTALFRPWCRGALDFLEGRPASAWTAIKPLFLPAHYAAYERALERDSFARKFVQPCLQAFLTRALAVGNDQTLVGRDGWLFYRPDLDYVTGPDFLDQSVLEQRAWRMKNQEGIPDPHPDPRPALIRFHQDCRKAGIHLVVVPVPTKTMVRFDRISRFFTVPRSAIRLDNPGFGRLARDLRAAGADVFEPFPEPGEPEDTQYLPQDTHWTPVFMASAARRLAAHIRQRVSLPPPAEPFRARLAKTAVTRVGDLVDMLLLPPNQSLYPPQSVVIQRVLDDRTGAAWQPDPNADVLLLGDSFTEIYSAGSLQWGRGAGFAEHLSFRLARPLDVIALNGGGATGTRRELARAENRSRLAVKRLVIYQFSMRDLPAANWVPLPLEISVPAPVVRAAPAVPAIAREAAGSGKTGSRPTSSVREAPLPGHPPAGAATSGTRPVREKTAPQPGSSPSAFPSALAPAPAAPAIAPVDATAAGKAENLPLVLVGRIEKISEVPQPYTAPYADCLTFILFRVEKVESGHYDDPILIAVFKAMQANQWLPPASYRPEQRFRLRLIPLKEAGDAVRSLQRADDLEDYTHLPYFVISEEEQN